MGLWPLIKQSIRSKSLDFYKIGLMVLWRSWSQFTSTCCYHCPRPQSRAACARRGRWGGDCSPTTWTWTRWSPRPWSQDSAGNKKYFSELVSYDPKSCQDLCQLIRSENNADGKTDNRKLFSLKSYNFLNILLNGNIFISFQPNSLHNSYSISSLPNSKGLRGNTC